MSEVETIPSTPTFEVGSDETIYKSINKEIRMDLDEEPSPLRFDQYTGEDLTNSPEQSECRQGLLLATKKIHTLLGIGYDAKESPISGKELPELPDLNRSDVEGRDYLPYLKRVRVLKKDIRDVVEGVVATGAEVPKYDMHTGEELSSDSAKKLEGCLNAAPAKTGQVMSDMRRKALLNRVDNIRKDARQELNDIADKGRQEAKAAMAPIEPEEPVVAEHGAVDDPVEPNLPLSQQNPKLGQEAESAKIDTQTLNLDELGDEALGIYSKMMGIEITPELRHAYTEGGLDGVTKYYTENLRARKLEEHKRADQIHQIQLEINDKIKAGVVRAYDERNSEVMSNLREGSEAVNAAFAVSPAGKIKDLGMLSAVRILTGKGLANEITRDHPDLAPTMDDAYKIVFDNPLIDQSLNITTDREQKPTEDDRNKRREEMIVAADDPRRFIDEYRKAKQEAGRL